MTPEIRSTTQRNVADIQMSHIQSFLTLCKVISVLIAILFIALAVLSFATAEEQHSYTSASGQTYWHSEISSAKIGAGIGYGVSGIISGIFLWKLSEVFCGFLYDVKVIRAEIEKEN